MKHFMKALPVIIFLLLIGFTAQAGDPNGQKPVLKSDIWEDAYFTKTNGKWVEGNRVPASEKNYNALGKIIEESEYDRGSLKTFTIHTYNSKGDLLEDLVYTDKNRTQLKQKIAYVYNQAYRLEKKVLYNYTESQETKEYMHYYDQNGNRIIEPHLSRFDRYDANENLLARFTNSGQLKFTRKYDKAGNEIESRSYTEDGSLGYKTTHKYRYNRQGKIVSMVEKAFDYQYNEADSNPDGPPYMVYDRKVFYVYDSDGNKVKKTIYEKLKDSWSYFPFKTSYRTLTYYEFKENLPNINNPITNVDGHHLIETRRK